MIRVGNLYKKIILIENLKLADKKAQRGKSKQFGVIKHNKNKKENILRLHDLLINNNYITSKYSLLTIYEPKERIISRLSYYPNRIVHHAIMNILEPIFVNCFISQTYSCIKNRGIHRCLKDLNNSLKDKENTYRIYTIKRLNDDQIFSIGDILSIGKITSIDIDEDGLYAKVDDYQIHYYLKDWKKKFKMDKNLFEKYINLA